MSIQTDPGGQPGKFPNEQQQIVNEQEQSEVINPEDKNYEQSGKEQGFEQGIKNDNLAEEKEIRKKEMPEIETSITPEENEREKTNTDISKTSN